MTGTYMLQKSEKQGSDCRTDLFCFFIFELLTMLVIVESTEGSCVVNRAL